MERYYLKMSGIKPLLKLLLKLEKEFGEVKLLAIADNNPKFFLSLNRRKKHERVYTIYQIFKSNFKDNTLISYDKLTPQDNPTKEILFNNLCASSPSILDFSDFSIKLIKYVLFKLHIKIKSTNVLFIPLAKSPTR